MPRPRSQPAPAPVEATIAAVLPPCEPAWRAFRIELEGWYGWPKHPRATIASVRRVFDILEDELGCRSFAGLTTDLVSRFCARDRKKNGQPGLSIHTVKGQLAYLRVICREAKARGLIPEDPTERNRGRWISERVLTEPKGLRTHLSLREVQDVLRQARTEAAHGSWKGRRLAALVMLLAYLGLRKKEALGLKVEDVNLAEAWLVIRGNERRGTKTVKSQAALPLPEPLCAWLLKWLPHCGGTWVIPASDVSKPWLHGGPGSRALDQLRALGERAGVPGVNFAIWRHSWATHAETLWGLTEEEIRRILRHTTPLTSRQFYRHGDLPNLREPMSRVGFDARPARGRGKGSRRKAR